MAACDAHLPSLLSTCLAYHPPVRAPGLNTDTDTSPPPPPPCRRLARAHLLATCLPWSALLATSLPWSGGGGCLPPALPIFAHPSMYQAPALPSSPLLCRSAFQTLARPRAPSSRSSR
eukprot:90163-Chlamydomonas_euryale.AAC.1